MLTVALASFKQSLKSLCAVEVVGDSQNSLRRLHNEGKVVLPYASLQVVSIEDSETYSRSGGFSGHAGGNKAHNNMVQYDKVLPIDAHITFSYATNDLESAFQAIKLIKVKHKQGDFNSRITVGTAFYDTSLHFDGSVSLPDPDEKGIILLEFDFVMRTYFVVAGEIHAITSKPTVTVTV